MKNLRFKAQLICALIAFILFSGSYILLSTEVSEQNKLNAYNYPNTFDLKEPMKNYDQTFEKLYSKYKDYYQRWEGFSPERDIEDPPEIDYYLEMEKSGKLPSHVTIYHSDYRALNSYRVILTDQKTYNNYNNIKLVLATNLKGISSADEILDWSTIDGEAAKMPSIPFFDLCLWVLGKYDGTNHLNNSVEGLLIACETMYFLGPELFPKEIKYANRYIFPFFRAKIESENYNPRILKILYLYERKEVYIRLACKIAKYYPVHFSTWGNDFESYKRKIRIAVTILEIEPFVLDLLKSGEINEYSQYDALVYLYNIGTIKQHLGIVFRILNNEWFGFSKSPTKYIDLLLKIKDIRIKKYFIKNKNKQMFSKYKIKIEDYIKNFDIKKVDGNEN